jgi:ATP-dependent Zn protease
MSWLVQPMSNYPPPTSGQGPPPPPPGYIPFATPAPPPRSFGKGIVGWVMFIGLIVLLFVVLRREQGPAYHLPLSEFSRELNSGNVRTVSIESDELIGDFVNPPPYVNGAGHFRTTLPANMASDWNFVHWMLDNRGNAVVKVNNNNSLLLQFVVPLIPWLLIFLFVWFFIFRQLRRNATQPARPAPVYIVNPEQRQP